jgi:hypothetical protein
VSEVDLTKIEAAVAEARRRQALLDQGVRTFSAQSLGAEYGALHGVNTPSPLLSEIRGERPTAVKAKPRMNGIETRRSIELEALRRAGEIQAWEFEGVTLRLAHDCRYTPDFFVLENSGAIRFEETKGFWRDDARVKIRVAAEKYPYFAFVALRLRKKKQGGGWAKEEF